MFYYPLNFICIILIFFQNHSAKITNIAVIGSNIEGMSFCNYLLKKSDGLVNITVFEKNSFIGNNHFKHKDQSEYDQEFIFDWNRNLKEIVKEYNLNLSIFEGFENIAIHDGESSIFTSKLKDSANNFRKLYGESVEILVKILRRFGNEQSSIYDVINKYPKNSLLDVIQDSKLDTILLKTRIDQFLLNLATNNSFVNGMIEPLLYSYVGKGTDLNTYTGLLTLFNHFNIKYLMSGGMNTLLNKILYDERYFNKYLHLNIETQVEKIKFLGEESKYQIFYKKSNKLYSSFFDKIVLASEINEIIFEDFPDLIIKNLTIIKNYPFIEKYTYLVNGNLNETCFNSLDCDLILFTKSKKSEKIERIENVFKNKYENRNYKQTGKPMTSIYKIYSNRNLEKSSLKYLFDNGYSLLEDNVRISKRFELIVTEDTSLVEQIFQINIDKVGLYNLKAYKGIYTSPEYALITSKNTANLIYSELKTNSKSEEINNLILDL